MLEGYTFMSLIDIIRVVFILVAFIVFLNFSIYFLGNLFFNRKNNWKNIFIDFLYALMNFFVIIILLINEIGVKVTYLILFIIVIEILILFTERKE